MFNLLCKPWSELRDQEKLFVEEYIKQNYQVFAKFRQTGHFVQIIEKAQPRVFVKGDLILKKGDQATFVLMIIGGTVGVYSEGRLIVVR